MVIFFLSIVVDSIIKSELNSYQLNMKHFVVIFLCATIIGQDTFEWGGGTVFKAYESQFPVSHYIIFHDCVGDLFIIHYFIPFHYCIWYSVNRYLPLCSCDKSHHLKTTWRYLYNYKFHNKLQYILLWWDPSKSKAQGRDWVRHSLLTICDVIKQNQSEVGNIDLKIQPNKSENVLCFLLF